VRSYCCGLSFLWFLPSAVNRWRRQEKRLRCAIHRACQLIN